MRTARDMRHSLSGDFGLRTQVPVRTGLVPALTGRAQVSVGDSGVRLSPRPAAPTEPHREIATTSARVSRSLTPAVPDGLSGCTARQAGTRRRNRHAPAIAIST